MTEQTIIDAFRMMWGNYHEPVRLIHRSFRVVDGNAAYVQGGGQLGGRCNATNPALHKGCRAMECLREGKTTCKTSEMGGVQWDSYWVPVAGCDDYFIHFTNGMNEFVKTMANTNQ